MTLLAVKPTSVCCSCKIKHELIAVGNGFYKHVLIKLSILFFFFKYIFQVADYNVAAAQQGIVYIDEVDKITKKVDLTHLFLFSFNLKIHSFTNNFLCPSL